MIDFYSNEYTHRTRFTGVRDQGEWGFISKTKSYIVNLTYKTDFILGNLKNRLISLDVDSLLFSQLEVIINELENKSAAEYILRGEKPKELLDCNNTDWDCFNTNQKINNKNNNLLKAELADFVTESDNINTKFNSHFHEYYMQAKQLNKFNCGFLPTFRRLSDFMGGVPNGRAFAYFDTKTENFLKYLDNFITYISKSTTSEVVQAFNLNWDGHESYNLTRLNYNNSMRQGKIDFNKIIDSGGKFLDSLKIGLKIIGVANITMTSSDDDKSMLMEHSAMGLSVFPEDESLGLPSARWLMVREVQAAAYCTQITMQIKPRLLTDYSNFELLVSKAINITLNQFGIIAIMNNVK